MSANADRRAALQVARAEALAARLDELLPLDGDERALDVGAGAGALSFAIAPRVRAVVALEADPELVARSRREAPSNVDVVEGDAEHLPFADFEFDVGATLRTLHHIRRPELAVAELVRVTRPGGTIFVVDQIAPVDPLEAYALNAFEVARDPSTTRILPDVDLRALFDANGLVLRRATFTHEPRELDAYLDLAGCEGDARERARALAPAGYTAELGWYLLRRP